MIIKFRCQKCGKESKSDAKHVGCKFICPRCGNEGRIPTPQELQQSSAIAVADPVPASVPQTPPSPKKLAKASPKPPEELADESSSPVEAPVEVDSDVILPRFKTLVVRGVVLAFLSGSLSMKVDNDLAIGSVMVAVFVLTVAVPRWYHAWNIAYHPERVREKIKQRLEQEKRRLEQEKRKQEQVTQPSPMKQRQEQIKQRREQAKRDQEQAKKYPNQEYKRTCQECGKVWHSLVSREAEIESGSLSLSMIAVGTFLVPSAGLQASRNLDAKKSELAQLRKCPNCFSTNYHEVVINHTTTT